MKNPVYRLIQNYKYYDEASQEHIEFPANTLLNPIHTPYLPQHLKDKLTQYKKSTGENSSVICNIGIHFIPIPEECFKELKY